MTLIARRKLLSLALGLVPLGAARPSVASGKAPRAGKRKHVLFVCTGNFYRSRFAEAIFKAHTTAGEWTASSRGLDTSKPRTTGVSPLVVEELERLKISQDLIAGYPRQLTREDLDAADVVVLLNGPEHAPMLQKQFPKMDMTKVRQWAVPDVPFMAAREAFAEIVRLVDGLMVELRMGTGAARYGLSGDSAPSRPASDSRGRER